MIRVTSSMLATNLKRNMNTNLLALERLQEQMSTGRKINKPSDNPAGTVRSLRLRTSIVQNEQYIYNIKDSISFLDTTDSALNNLNSAIQRARELMVKGGNSTNDAGAFEAIRQEISELDRQIRTVANSSYGSKYIFSGSNVTETPCTDNGWTGNSNALLREIGIGVTMQVNIDMKDWFIGPATSTSGANPSTAAIMAGARSFQINVDGDTTGPHTVNLTVGVSGGANIAADMQTQIQALGGVYSDVTVEYSAEGRYVITSPPISGSNGENSQVVVTAAATDDVSAALKLGTDNGGTEISGIFNVLQQVENALAAGDNATVGDLLANMDLKINDLLRNWSIVGARTNRLEMQKTRLESNHTSYTELLAANEDADMSEVAIRLKMQENVYNASLSVGAQIIQPSLIDFLR